MAQEKIFILDTNVLIHDPKSIFSFAPELIGIPLIVIEELDQFKAENSQRGFSAREVIRTLDDLRKSGSLGEGVTLENGGSLKVLLFDESVGRCSTLIEPDTPDNMILYMSLCLQKQGFDVQLVSKDLNVRVKADALGLDAVDYLKDIVSKDNFYKGWRKISVPSIQLKREFPEDLLALIDGDTLVRNEFVIVESQNNPHNYRVFRFIGGGKFKAIEEPHLGWPIHPRNAEQMMALDLLLDNDIQFVSLSGPAGTGKTFLVLAAALHKILIEKEFIKILISRPVVPLGPDIGYLPGDIQEKLHSWMQPIYDNMDFITHTVNASQEKTMVEVQSEEPQRNGRQRREERRKKRGDGAGGMPSLDDLVHRGKISLEAITYMRGRSIPYQYIFIDEVQNLTPHEVKTIVSRVGEGSKIVLAGDPYQIDSPYLDFTSNGLMVAAEHFRGQAIFGTVFLETSERSELSRLAGELL